jgi:ATP-dependent Clp protease ATP-binding subunit ClpA
VLTPSLIEFHGGELVIYDAAIHQAVNMAKRYLSSIPKSAQILDQARALVRTKSSQASESWQYIQSCGAALQVEITALKVIAMVISIDDLSTNF